jgi:carboxylesterase type B
MFLILIIIYFKFVGALGFLAIQDEQTKGNFGILDQRLAINWF